MVVVVVRKIHRWGQWEATDDDTTRQRERNYCRGLPDAGDDTAGVKKEHGVGMARKNTTVFFENIHFVPSIKYYYVGVNSVGLHLLQVSRANGVYLRTPSRVNFL